ncbi:hemolysin family protein [Funiculus sociatus GB2-A5]|jgi:putative hemolysin|uniref:Hemolysin family protein n=1 Tax=Funiculus sociatus GB2-A5 TaxID=2933946 RepID=A0ABV0JQ90_9CYAN|nr:MULTISPECIES: hemolysin family protein [unclassified Trichocoleus]MBD1904419.1 HlyC/CorC family transporter [Trichocoleus sp. FACHB-832]MBD1933790.1 HlyC/CorC family transporter [Trichocoleus sp. FACHB-69]MBD2062244.1 HlyC/CorC family transporter [Trichocoleus sp. FACHB-6]
MSPTTEILIIFLLTILNGIFVMSELAIVSARKIRLQQLADRGDIKARAALELANAPNQFLAIVQVGITLIVILSGAFGEGTIAKRLVPALGLIPWLAPYKEAIASAVAILIITYLTLIIGELVPKRLALNYPERIASAVAIPMRMLAAIASPIVYVLSASTDMVVRMLGIKPSTEPLVTERDITDLIEQGTEAGTFEEAEQDMVERVFGLGDKPVSALMTPRPDITWLDLEDSPDENQQKIINSTYSRFPVCQDSLDHVLGVIPVSDLLARSLSGQPLDLTVSLQQPVFVPESMGGLKVLELFKQTGTHMALVVDEYGVTQGLLTLNDIFVEIVGDVPSADEAEDPPIVQREDGSWLVDGMLPVQELFELLDIEELPGEQKGNYHTMGGFVMTHLGKIPTAADHFELDRFRFEVMDMDGNRVDKVLVMPIPTESIDSESGD